MLKDFDIAFTNKIKKYYSNTIYANTAIVYNVAYNLVDDASIVLEFPLISIYRPTGFEISQIQNFMARKQGFAYSYDSNTNKSNFARFIRVNLAYQLDIYAKSPETLDDITEEVIGMLNLDSTLTVKQYDTISQQDHEEVYDIVYNNGPVEQSEFQNGDRVYHYSLVYQISNAKLFNFKQVGHITSVITQQTIDKETKE